MCDINQKGSKFEIVNPSDQLTPDPNNSHDPNSDYFPDDPDNNQTETELNSYSLDTFKTPEVGDIIKILEDWVINNITLNENTYHVVKNVNEENVKIIVDDVIFYPNFTARSTKWEIVNPSDQLTPDPNNNTDSGLIVFGDDGTNGVGYYYPVYLSNSGLGSYHTHVINNTTYYMEDSNMNHAQSSIPSGNTLTFDPNGLSSPQYVQAVYGYNYLNKSAGLSRNSDGSYQYMNPPTYTHSMPNISAQIIDSYTLDSNLGFVYNVDGIIEDSYPTSIKQGQGILGNMSNYVHFFEIFRYKINNIQTSSTSTPSGTATHELTILPMDFYHPDFADDLDKVTRFQSSLNLFAEYSNQPNGSIWELSNSTWGYNNL